MAVTLKVLNNQKEIATHTISKGQTVTINAQQNVNYQLIDEATGFAPQNIIVKRENNHLLVNFDDGDMETDLIIEDYYTDKGTTNQLIGLHENGQLYPYVPQSGESVEAISLLAEQVSSAQALGSEAIATPLWFFNPWWLAGAAGVVGAVALAAGGGSGGGNGNAAVEESADKPNTFSDKAGNTSVLPGDDNTEIKVTYTPNGQSAQSTLTIKKIGNEWKAVDANGQEIENNQLPQGVTVDSATGQVSFEPSALAPNSTVSAIGSAAGKKPADTTTPTAANGLVAASPVIEIEDNGDKFVLAGEDNNELNIVYTLANSSTPATLTVKKIGDTWQAVNKEGQVIANSVLPEGVSINPANGQVTFKNNTLAPTSDLIATGKADGKIDARVKDVESVADAPETFVDQTGNTNVSPGDDNNQVNVEYTLKGQTTPSNLTLKKIDNEWKVVDSAGNVIDAAQLPDGITVDSASGKVSFAPETLAPNTTVNAVGTAAGKKPANTASPISDNNTVADTPNIDIQPNGEKNVLPGDDNNEMTVAYTPSNATSPSTLTVKKVGNDWKAVDKNGQLLAQSALPQGITIDPTSGKVSFTPDALVAGSEVTATGKASGKLNAQIAEKDSDNDGITDTKETDAKQAIEDAIAEAEKAAKAYEKALVDANENNTIGEKDVEALQKAAQAVVDAKQKAQDLIDNLPKTMGENDAESEKQASQPRLDAVKTPVVPNVNDSDDDGISDAKEAEIEQAVTDALNAAKQAKADYDAALKAAGEAIDADDVAKLTELANKVNAANEKAKALIEALPQTRGTTDTDKAYTEAQKAAAAELEDVQAPSNNDADSDEIADSKEAEAQQAVEQAIENAKIAKQAYEAELAKAGEAVDAKEAEKLAELAKAVNEANARAKDLASKLPETIGTTESDKTFTDAQQAAADQLTDVTAPANNDADADGISDSKEAEVKQALQEAIDFAKAAKEAYEAELAKAGDAIDATEAAKLNELAKAVNNANAKAKTLAEQLPTTLGTTEGDQATTTAQQTEVAKLEDVTVPGNNDIDGDNIADDAETAAQQAVEQAIENAKIAKQAYEDALAQAGEVVDADEVAKLNELAKAVNNANARAKELAKQLPNLIGITEGDQTYTAAQQAEAAKLDDVAAPANNDADADGITDQAELNTQAELAQAIEDAKAAKQAYDTALAKAGDAVDAKEQEELAKLANEVNNANAKAKALVDNLPTTLGTTESDKAITAEKQAEVAKLTDVQAPSNNDADSDNISDSKEAEVQQAVSKAIEEAKAAKQAYDTELAKAGSTITPAEAEKLTELAKAVNNANAKAKALVDALPTTLGTTEDDQVYTQVQQAETEKLEDVQPPSNNDADSDEIADSKEAEAQQAVEQAIENAKIAKQAYEAELAKAGEAVDATEAAKLAELAKAVNEANAKAKDLASKLPETIGTTESDKTFTDAQQAAAEQLTDVTAPANNDADADGISDSKEADIETAIADAFTEAEKAKAEYDAALKAAGEAIDADDITKLTELANKVNAANEKAKALIEVLPQTRGTTDTDKAYTDAQKANAEQLKDVTVPANNDADADGITDSKEAAAQQAVEQAIENAKIAKQAYDTALAQAGDAVDATEAAKLAELAQAVNEANAKAKALADNLSSTLGTTEGDQAYTAAQQAEAEKLEDVQAPSNNDADSDEIADSKEAEAQQAVEQAIENAKIAKQAYEAELAKAGEAVDAEEAAKLAELAKAVNEANARAKDLASKLPETIGTTESDKTFTDAQQAAADQLTDVTAPANNDADADGISDSKEADVKQAIADALQAAETAKTNYETALANAGEAIDAAEAENLATLATLVNNANAKAKALIAALPTTLGETADDKAYTNTQKETAQGLIDVQAPANSDTDADNIADQTEAAAKQAVEQAIENAKIAKQTYEAELAKAGEAVDADEVAKLNELAQAVNNANAKAKELAKQLPNLIGTTEGDQTYTAAQQAEAAKLDDVAAPANNDADADGITDQTELNTQTELAQAIEDAKAAKQAYDSALAKAGDAVDAKEQEELAKLANEVNNANAKAKALVDNLPTTLGTTDSDKAITAEKQAEVAKLTDVQAPSNNDADADNISDSNEAAAQNAVAQAIEEAKSAKQAYDTALAQAGDAVDATEAAKLNELAKAVNNANAKAKALVENLPTTIGTTEGDQTVTAEKQAEVAKLEDVTAPANNDADADGISDGKETEAQQAVEQAIENAKIAKQAYEAELAKAGEAVDATEAAKLAELAKAVNEANAKAKDLVSKLPETIGTTESDKTFTDAQQAAVAQLTDVTAPANNDADADGISDTREARAKQAVEEAIFDAKEAKNRYEEALAQAGEAVDADEVEKLTELAKAVNEANAKAKALAEQLPETVGSTVVDKEYAANQQAEAAKLQDVTPPANNDADADGISDGKETEAQQAVEQAIENAKIAKQAYDTALAQAGDAVDATEAAKLAELAQAVNEANAKAKDLASKLPETIGTTESDKTFTDAQQAAADQLTDVTAPENNDADADGISDSKEDEAKAAVQQALADVAAAKQAYDTALAQAGNAYNAEEVKTLTDLADKVNAANAKAKALIEALPTTIGNQGDENTGDQAYIAEQNANALALEDITAPSNNDADSDDISNAAEDAAKQAVDSAIEKAKLAKQNFDEALARLGEAYDANDVAELTELANKANTAKQEAETLANNLGNTIGNQTAEDQQYAQDKQAEASNLPTATAPANNDADADGITDNAETEAKTAVEKAFEDVAAAKDAYNAALTNAGDAVDAQEAENLANLAAALNAANAKAKTLIEALPTTIGNQGDENTGDKAYIAEQNAKAAELEDVTAPSNSDKDSDNISDAAEANAKQAVDSAIEKAKQAKQNFDDALARLGEAYDEDDVNTLTELAEKANAAKQEAIELADKLPETIGNTTDEDKQYATDKQTEANGLPSVTAPANNDADKDGITNEAETAAKQALEEAISAANTAKQNYEAALAEAGEAVNAEEAENLRKLADKVNSANEHAKNLANNLGSTIGNQTAEDQQYATDKQAEANALTDVTAPSNSDADNDNISNEAETAAKQAVEQAIEDAKAAKQAYETALSQAGSAIDAEEAKKLAELAAEVNAANTKAKALAEKLPETVGNTESDQPYNTEKQTAANGLQDVQSPANSDADGDDITDQAEAEAKKAMEKALEDAATAKTAYDNAVRDAGDVITPEEATELAKLAKAVNDANATAKALAEKLPETVGNTESDQPYNTEKQTAANGLQDVTAPSSNDTDSDGITNEAETEAKQAMEKALEDAATAKTAYDNAVRDAGEAITPEEATELAKLAKAVNDANATAKALAKKLPETVGNTESDQPYNTEKQTAANGLQDVTAPTANDTDADGITDAKEAKAKQDVQKAFEDAAAAKTAYDKAVANAGSEISDSEVSELVRLATALNEANKKAKDLVSKLPTDIGTSTSDNQYKQEQDTEVAKLKDAPQIQEPDAITITNIKTGTKDEVGGVTIRLDNNGANTDKVVVRFQDEQGVNQVVTYTKSGSTWTADKAINGMTMANGTITLKPNTVAGAKEIGKTATAAGTDGMEVQAESLRNNNLNGANVAKQKVATSAGVASTDKSPEALVMGLDNKGNVEVAGIADKVKLVVDYNGTPVTLSRADTNADWSGLPSGVTISADKTKLLIADSAIPTDKSVTVKVDGNNDVNPEIATTYDPNVPQVTFTHGSSTVRNEAGQVTVTANAAHTRMVIKYYDETGVLYGGAKPMVGDPTLKEVVAVKTGNTWRFETAPQLYTGDKDIDPGSNDIIISGNSVVFKPNAILDSSKIMVTAYTAAGKSVVQLDRAKEDYQEEASLNWNLFNETPTTAEAGPNAPTNFRKKDVGDVMFQGSSASEQMYIEYFNNAGELVTTKFVRPEGTTYSPHPRTGVMLARIPAGSKSWVMEDGSEVAAPFIILTGRGVENDTNSVNSNVIKLDGSQVLDNSVVTLYSYYGLGKANVSKITSLGENLQPGLAPAEAESETTSNNSLKSALEKSLFIPMFGDSVIDFGKQATSISEIVGTSTTSSTAVENVSETGANNSLSEEVARYADNGTIQPLLIEQPQISLI